MFFLPMSILFPEKSGVNSPCWKVFAVHSSTVLRAKPGWINPGCWIGGYQHQVSDYQWSWGSTKHSWLYNPFSLILNTTLETMGFSGIFQIPLGPFVVSFIEGWDSKQATAHWTSRRSMMLRPWRRTSQKATRRDCWDFFWAWPAKYRDCLGINQEI